MSPLAPAKSPPHHPITLFHCLWSTYCFLTLPRSVCLTAWHRYEGVNFTRAGILVCLAHSCIHCSEWNLSLNKHASHCSPSVGVPGLLLTIARAILVKESDLFTLTSPGASDCPSASTAAPPTRARSPPKFPSRQATPGCQEEPHACIPASWRTLLPLPGTQPVSSCPTALPHP